MWDLNPQPITYKTIALPIELMQHKRGEGVASPHELGWLEICSDSSSRMRSLVASIPCFLL